MRPTPPSACGTHGSSLSLSPDVAAAAAKRASVPGDGDLALARSVAATQRWRWPWRPIGGGGGDPSAASGATRKGLEEEAAARTPSSGPRTHGPAAALALKLLWQGYLPQRGLAFPARIRPCPAWIQRGWTSHSADSCSCVWHDGRRRGLIRLLGWEWARRRARKRARRWAWGFFMFFSRLTETVALMCPPLLKD
jgi:hypothetical protein